MNKEILQKCLELADKEIMEWQQFRQNILDELEKLNNETE